MRSLLREPLLHFFFIGVLMFGAYGLLNRGSLVSEDEIVVSRGQVQNLLLQFERVWLRPATMAEQQALIENWVREEIFYREGVAMGLDRDDALVRRQIGQKLEFMLESATPPPPTDAELQAWLDAHPEDYRVDPTYSVRQVYFDPARHGEALEGDMAVARHALAAGEMFAGDSTMLPPTMDAVTAIEAGQIFGSEFGEALETLSEDGWQGPVESSFGLHLVALIRHNDTRPAALAEVRADVERDLLHARKEAASAAFYDKLRANYRVRIEGDSAIAEPPG